MTSDRASRYKEELLVETIADALGFDVLSERLPGHVYPPYLLVATTLLIEYVIVDGYNYLVAGKASFVTDPLSLVTAVGLVLAVVGIRWMRDSYAEAIASLRLSEQHTADEYADSLAFTRIVPLRIKRAAYAGGVVLLLYNHFVLLGLPALLEIQGVVSTIVYNFTLQPLVYVPLIVEFGLLYVGIHFTLPRRIIKADIDLFYYDPKNMGGFAAIGQLLKRSYYLFTAGLLLYFVLIYGASLLGTFISTPYPEPTTALAVMFTVLWVVGLVSIGYSMYRIHTHMSAKKAAEITRIEDELRSEILDEPYDIQQSNIAGHERQEEIQHRIEQVRSTREYPSTFTMWSQIAVSVLLPQLLQLAVRATL